MYRRGAVSAFGLQIDARRAGPRVRLGYILGYISAISRLYLSCISAPSRAGRPRRSACSARARRGRRSRRLTQGRTTWDLARGEESRQRWSRGGALERPDAVELLELERRLVPSRACTEGDEKQDTQLRRQCTPRGRPSQRLGSCASATARLQLGYVSATSRQHVGCSGTCS